MSIELDLRIFLWNLRFQRELARFHRIENPRLKKWGNLYKRAAANPFIYRSLFPYFTKPNNVRFDEYGAALLLLDHDSKGYVLDVGSGASSFPSFLAMMSKRVICADIARYELLEHKNAVKNLKIEGEVHFIVADAQNLPLRSKSVSQVSSISTFEHIPDESKASKEVGRILSESGIFVLTLPFIMKGEKSRILADGSFERWYTEKLLKERIIIPSGLILKARFFIVTSMTSGKYLSLLKRTPLTNLLSRPFGRRARTDLHEDDSRYILCVVARLKKIKNT